MENNVTSRYGNLSEVGYLSRINTPSTSPEYFDRFHRPLVERALARSKKRPINLLDVAMGYGYELDPLKDREDIKIYGVDISDKVLGVARERLGRQTFLHTWDVRDESIVAFPTEIEPGIDIALAVNAVVYAPYHVLLFMFDCLKIGGEAAVNFRDFSNPNNGAFYDFYLAQRARIYDGVVSVGDEIFKVKVLDYRKVKDNALRNLDRQIYFQSTEDIERLIRAVGFEIVGQDTFNFSSPADPNNETDVFTLKKSQYIPFKKARVETGQLHTGEESSGDRLSEIVKRLLRNLDR